MTMTEDAVLERVLVEADPARTPRDARPDPAALVARDRIIRRGAAPRRRDRVRWASGLVGAVAATVIAVAVLVPHGGAVAATPRPLQFTSASSVTATVDAAQKALAASAGPVAEPVRTVRTAAWSFDIDMDAGRTTVVPQLTTLHWEPDLSGHVTVIAGEPYDPADAAANLHAEVSSSGTVTLDDEMKPGEFNTPVVDAPGDSAEEISAALISFGMPEQPTAYDVVTATTSILGQWTLTNAQHARLLALLEKSGGAEDLGESTDRLGRPVAGIRVRSADGAAADVMLISLETGRIIGIERTALVDDSVIKAGSVISYVMWDVDERLIG